jgi:hypothetical protein
VAETNQAEYARLLADILNQGVLQDAVPAGLEDQGPFVLDALDVLDALGSARLKLVPDDESDATNAYTSLTELHRGLESGDEGDS